MADSLDSRAREVLRIGDKAFSDKSTVNSLHQELAENFYPKMATFTTSRDQGEEYADHLYSSFPVLARRELGNILAEYLRPDKWFSIHVDDEALDEDDQNRAFLEHLTGIEWRAMNDHRADLVGAMGQHDHDFATFGNTVIEFGLNLDGDGLLFRNFHLRDNAWAENAEGKIDANHRNWNPTAIQLKRQFGEAKVSKNVKEACRKDPYKEFPCRRVVLPSRLYDYKSKTGKRFPFVSLYVERESETVLEEVGLNHFCYVIPRWQKVAGSVWGTSMATDVLLPDGRTLQVVMRTLREAGESYVNPPLIAFDDAIRGDIALYPGGITTADREYDERLGEVLRPITQNSSGFPIGLELASALKEDISKGWFLDKIKMPETSHQMTATQVRRIIQEHIRAAAPISKPIQKESNHPMCEGVFNLLLDHGAFPTDQMPDALQGRELQFKFRSPLDELAEQNEAEVYLDIRDRIIAPAAQFDPAVMDEFDMVTATKDAARAGGWKAKWNRSREDKERLQQVREEKMQAEQMMNDVASGGQVAQEAGKGIDALMTAGAARNGKGAGRAA